MRDHVAAKLKKEEKEKRLAAQKKRKEQEAMIFQQALEKEKKKLLNGGDNESPVHSSVKKKKSVLSKKKNLVLPADNSTMMDYLQPDAMRTTVNVYSIAWEGGGASIASIWSSITLSQLVLSASQKQESGRLITRLLW